MLAPRQFVVSSLQREAFEPPRDWLQTIGHREALRGCLTLRLASDHRSYKRRTAQQLLRRASAPE
jgi:hypothetical protein